MKNFVIDDILSFYYNSCSNQKRVGVELEFFCIKKSNNEPIPIDGDGGLLNILMKFEELCSYTKKDYTTIMRKFEQISIEPGGQLEYSSPPCLTIEECKKNVQNFLIEFQSIVKLIGDVDIHSHGIHPFCDVADIAFVHTDRYSLLRKYLVQKGELAEAMMKTTASIHINIDYNSESEAMKLLQIAFLISPIICAFFANSACIKDGENYRIYRRRIWDRTDNERTKMPANFFESNIDFHKYISHVISLPMIYVNRNGWKYIGGKITFKDYMAKGYKGINPTLNDYLVHLNTIFYDARLKNYIEIRSIDAQPINSLMSPAIFWYKLFSNPVYIEKAINLMAFASPAELSALDKVLPTYGLDAKIGNRKIKDVANAIRDIVI